MVLSVSYTNPASPQQSAPANSANTAKSSDRAAEDAGSPANDVSSPTDTVELSTQAQAVLSGQTTATESFADVTANARAVINAGYATLKAAGTPFDYNTATQTDWKTVFGSLDRRSLFAVASNSEGQFTSQEQDIAQSIMSEQEGTAMGLYPPGQGSPGISASAPFSINDPAPSFAAGIAFMDSVSPEEKASANWAVQRAELQDSYEATVTPQDGTPKNVDSGNPIVDMLASALKSLKSTNAQTGISASYVKNFSDLKNLPLFANGNYASQLQQALQQLQTQQTNIDSRSVDISA
jgi:hypothetical protein